MELPRARAACSPVEHCEFCGASFKTDLNDLNEICARYSGLIWGIYLCLQHGPETRASDAMLRILVLVSLALVLIRIVLFQPACFSMRFAYPGQAAARAPLRLALVWFANCLCDRDRSLWLLLRHSVFLYSCSWLAFLYRVPCVISSSEGLSQFRFARSRMAFRFADKLFPARSVFT